MQSETEFKVGDIAFYKEKPYEVKEVFGDMVVLFNQYLNKGFGITPPDIKEIIKINIGDQLLIDKSFIQHPIWSFLVTWCSRHHKSPEWVNKFIDSIENQKPVNLGNIHDETYRGSLENDLNKIIKDTEFPILRLNISNEHYNALVPLQFIKSCAQVEAQPSCVCPTLDLMRWGHNKVCYLYKENSR